MPSKEHNIKASYGNKWRELHGAYGNASWNLVDADAPVGVMIRLASCIDRMCQHARQYDFFATVFANSQNLCTLKQVRLGHRDCWKYWSSHPPCSWSSQRSHNRFRRWIATKKHESQAFCFIQAKTIGKTARTNLISVHSPNSGERG